jgi:hypothetical protein
MITKATSSTPATARLMTTLVSCQPSLLLISPYTSEPSAPLKVAKPSQSGREAPGSRDSATRVSVMVMAAIPTGMFTKKIQRHPRPLVMTPPRTGPTATATPVTAPNTPNAAARSRPRKASLSNASEVANMTAPPMPCPARARLRKIVPVARPHSSEPAVKTTVPAANITRRPHRSAREPAVRSAAARVRA